MFYRIILRKMRPYFTFLDLKVDNAEGLFRFCSLIRKENNPGLDP